MKDMKGRENVTPVPEDEWIIDVGASVILRNPAPEDGFADGDEGVVIDVVWPRAGDDPPTCIVETEGSYLWEAMQDQMERV